MKAWAAVCFLLLAAAGGRAEAYTVFKLPDGSRIEFFPVGRWKIASEDVGELKIILEAADPGVNGRAILSVASEGSDDFPTEEKLREQMHRVAERAMAAGDFVERRPVVKPFYPTQGFGYYAVLTDRRQAGRPSSPGNFKFFTLGMIRLAPTVYLRVQIMADGEEEPAYQQLLGMAEGVVFTPR